MCLFDVWRPEMRRRTLGKVLVHVTKGMSDNSFIAQLVTANQKACASQMWNHCSVIKYQWVVCDLLIRCDLKEGSDCVAFLHTRARLTLAFSECFYKVEPMQSVAAQRHGWCMMGSWYNSQPAVARLSSLLCSRIAGLMVFRTGWWGRSTAAFSSVLCRKKN